MPVTPARQAAFKVLLRVERESAYAVELLHSTLLDRLSSSDRNLTTEIAMGVLRWRSRLDESFAGLLSVPLRRLDLEVLTALRMGVYELAFLDRTPGRAIVNQAVELVKTSGKRSASGMVNAVLRKLESNRSAVLSSGKGLARDYAHPEWLVERWLKHFGAANAESICRYDQQAPPTVLRVQSETDEQALRAEGIKLAPGSLMRAARVVTSRDATRTSLLQGGQIAIQDEGSQLVAALVGKGRRILDCCAAPGSKTAALATAQSDAQIFATELHPHRARLLRKLAPQTNVHVLVADARNLPFHAEFDRVLADVPCSGTGTLSRNPEIKWKLTEADLGDLRRRQIEILDSVLDHVASPGRLVYSTCSLEAEENEQVVEACLQRRRGFRLVPAAGELQRLKESGEVVWDDVEGLTKGAYLRTLPGVHPCDGFFAAILERT